MELWTEIRRRVLGGELSKRAACREYELHWDTLCKILQHVETLVIGKLVDLLDTPDIQRRLQKAIARQMKATENKTRDTKSLRQRIAELEKNIDKGVERLLLLEGEDLNDASRMLADWRQQRRTLEEQLQASEHKREGSPQREAALVAAELADLRETFAVADPATLRAALATVIEDVTLYWTDGGPRKYQFQRGTIRLGGSLRVLASCESTSTNRQPTTDN